MPLQDWRLSKLCTTPVFVVCWLSVLRSNRRSRQPNRIMKLTYFTTLPLTLLCQAHGFSSYLDSISRPPNPMPPDDDENNNNQPSYGWNNGWQNHPQGVENHQASMNDDGAKNPSDDDFIKNNMENMSKWPFQNQAMYASNSRDRSINGDYYAPSENPTYSSGASSTWTGSSRNDMSNSGLGSGYDPNNSFPSTATASSTPSNAGSAGVSGSFTSSRALTGNYQPESVSVTSTNDTPLHGTYNQGYATSSANIPTSTPASSWEAPTQIDSRSSETVHPIPIHSASSLQHQVQAMIDEQYDSKKGIYRYKEAQPEETKIPDNALTKQARLAFTGGISVRKELSTERPVPDLDTKGMTKRILCNLKTGDTSTWEAFVQAEKDWDRLRHNTHAKRDFLAKPFVVENDIEKGHRGIEAFQKLSLQKGQKLDYDVVVCGGSTGIFYATVLQLRGHRVCVVEAKELADYDQDWSLSMEELKELVRFGVLSDKDVEDAIHTEFKGSRFGFKNKEFHVDGGYSENGVGTEFFVDGVMNLVVSQSVLLERVLERFKEMGGVVLEKKAVSGIFVVSSMGAALDIGQNRDPLTARLVLDAMGTTSPITQQQREGKKPDGVCVVVGSCAGGYDPATNLVGDAVYTNTPLHDKGRHGMLQYFWRSFPIGIGRNGKEPGDSDVKATFMFTYMDAQMERPTLESLMEDYWKLLPHYQPSIQNPEFDLHFQRVLFGFYPTYKDSPLPPVVDRVLAVGGAAGSQSPLDFGGLSSLVRDLGRVSDAVTEALECDLLRKEDLAEINAYAPNLKASWMLQQALIVKMGKLFVDPRFVNRLLATNVEAMKNVGKQDVQPFLQGSYGFDTMIGSLMRSAAADPTIIPSVITWIGLPAFLDCIGHVGMMGAYAALDSFLTPLLRPVGETMLRKNSQAKYHFHRKLDSWKYGSGNE